jgi:hypothetical protein
MPCYPKSKTNARFLLLIGDLVDSFPEDHVFHVEDIVKSVTTKNRLISGKSLGRLLPREPNVIGMGHGRWRVKHA